MRVYKSFDKEKLDVFDCSNVLIASCFTEDRGCAHCNREHTLIYIHSGELEITAYVKKCVLHAGECAFMRWDRSSLVKFPSGRPDVRSLFEALLPYFDEGVAPDDVILKMKMAEGMFAILKTDESQCAPMFDSVDPWEIDIVDFMERNYMNDLSMAEIAYYTSRSLATFKRDSRKVSELTPEKWLIRRRLQAARELICKGGHKVSEVCFDAGFKNLSHFSRLYKAMYGMAPTFS